MERDADTSLPLQVTDDLFRREVVEARRSDWLGGIHLVRTRLAWPMAAVAILAIVAIAGLLVFGSITRKVRAEGALVPADGLLDLAAARPGVVAKVFVREGEAVRAGDALFELAGDSGDARGRGVAAGVEAALAREDAQLRGDLVDADRDLERQRGLRSDRLASIERQLAASSRQFALKQRQAETARRTLERVRPLSDQRIVSAVQLAQYESAALDADAAVEVARQERLDLEQSLAEARDAMTGVELDGGPRRSGIARALSDVAQARARAAGELGQRVVAPRDGRVSGLSVTPGQAVVAGQRLATVLPAGSPLRAELWVPSAGIGDVAPGTRVALRYHAWPYQRFGVQGGRVVEIAGRASPPDEVRLRTGRLPSAPAYRVLVALDTQTIAGTRAPSPLRASMTLDADLLLERQPLHQLVFAPLRTVGETSPSRSTP